MLQHVLHDIQETQSDVEHIQPEAVITRKNTNKPAYDNLTYERHYFEDTEQFRHILNSFNRCKEGEIAQLHFSSVGYANAKLRFCTRCLDAGKKLQHDLYFVNRKQKSTRRTVLCLGCLGSLLQDYKNAVAFEGRQAEIAVESPSLTQSTTTNTATKEEIKTSEDAESVTGKENEGMTETEN